MKNLLNGRNQFYLFSYNIMLDFKMSIIYKISLPCFLLPKDHIFSIGSLIPLNVV